MSVEPAPELHHHPVKGVAFMLAGTVFFALADALGKWLTALYPLFQVSWLRSVMGLLLVGGVALASGQGMQLRTRRPVPHLLRSLVSIGLSLGIFYGLRSIPLAEFVAIIFTTPIMLAVLSPWLLGESVSGRTWAAVTLGFVGILLVVRPIPGHFHVAHFTTLGIALTTALLAISARTLSRTETGLSLNFYIYPGNVLFAAWFAWRDWMPMDALSWLLMLMLGVTATVALWCLIQAMRCARPAMVAPLDYVRLVWTILLGFYVWGEVPVAATWAGMLIIVTCGAYVMTHSGLLPAGGGRGQRA